MDENTLNQLEQALKALKALERSTTHGQRTGMTSGTAKLAARSYTNLYEKITELLPDDMYIQSLAVDLDEAEDDQDTVSQINFVATNLYAYLKDLLRDAQKNQRSTSGEGNQWNFNWGNMGMDPDELRNLGRDIQEQVMGITRTTVRRALSNVDIDLDISDGKDLRKAYIMGENWGGRNLANADLRRAVITDTNVEGGNFQNADLRKTFINNVNMQGGNFKGADVRKVVIINTNLMGANFHRVDMRASKVWDTNFTGANLNRASLRGVNLIDCDLRGANLTDADVRGMVLYQCKIDATTTMPDGQPYQDNLDQFGIGWANGPIPPIPPLPPMPPTPPEAPEKPKRKEKRRVVINIGDHEHDVEGMVESAMEEVDAAMEQLDEEIDALDAEMDDITDEMTVETENRRQQADERQRNQIERRRARLEQRRAQIEAEMARLEAQLDADEDDDPNII